MKTLTFTLPEYWNEYLTKNDVESLSMRERDKADDFMAKQGILGRCGKIESSGPLAFTRHDADTGPACNVLTYTFSLWTH